MYNGTMFVESNVNIKVVWNEGGSKETNDFDPKKEIAIDGETTKEEWTESLIERREQDRRRPEDVEDYIQRGRREASTRPRRRQARLERGGNGGQEPSVPSWLASPAPMSTVVSGEAQTPALVGHELQPWSMRAEATRDLALRLRLRSSRSKADPEGLLLTKAHDLKRGSAVRPLTECFTDGFCACIAAAYGA